MRNTPAHPAMGTPNFRTFERVRRDGATMEPKTRVQASRDPRPLREDETLDLALGRFSGPVLVDLANLAARTPSGQRPRRFPPNPGGHWRFRP